MSAWQIQNGDALEEMARLPEGTVQTVVTDPPYGIGISGEAWDGKDIRRQTAQADFGIAFQEFTAAWANECYRLLPPGGHLVAFAAPRMSHHLAVGIERAGFELRDQLIWAFGTGMVKSKKLPGGRSTQLKPGYEPILLARRPLDGSVERNEARYGTGTLQVEATGVKRPKPVATGVSPWWWPANLVVSHDTNCRIDQCVEACPRAIIDQQSLGQVSRIFYCPKTSTTEREAGLDGMALRETQIYAKGGARPRRNFHPTVKPVSLMRWVIRLTSPASSTILDPFCGSGTTGIAAGLEGRRFIGVEKQGEYADIARRRIEHWTGGKL